MGRGGTGTAALVALLSAPAPAPGPLLSAVEHLGRMRHEAALPGFLHLLKSEHPEVVLASLAAIRKLKPQRRSRDIFVAMEHPSTEVREAAVATLRECGDAWAAAALLSWSKRHRRDRVVASAARLVAARLQDRHGALPAPAEGALTLLEDSNTCGGELSIPAADIGAVSLPPR